MTETITNINKNDVRKIQKGFNKNPSKSHSIHKDTYVKQKWFDADLKHVIGKSWQWICHGEKLKHNGMYVTAEVAKKPIIVIRDNDGKLNAFYNVCQHRAHELLKGEGQIKKITCPYHAWTYKLNGKLAAAPHTENLVGFDMDKICLHKIKVEEFCGFIFVNLDKNAKPLKKMSGDLETEIRHWAPDIQNLTFAHRLNYNINANWKNVVDNFLECYHCPTAHKDFCELVDMDTYKVTTHGIYSSHMAEAGQNQNSAYDVSNATVKTHAVWWMYPTTCIMRYPGRSSIIILNIIPDGPEKTRETYDFFLETKKPNKMEKDTIKYLDEVLQVEDINLVESVQKGMNTPAFEYGRIVNDPDGSGKSEHAVHHFHKLIINAYKSSTQTKLTQN